MSKKQKNEVQVEKYLDVLLTNVSLKLEEENIIEDINGSQLNNSFISRWENNKNLYQTFREFNKKQTKPVQEELQTDLNKRKIKKPKKHGRIDLAMNFNACVDQRTFEFCSGSSFYSKYKNLVRSLSSQKWRAWTAGATPVTKDQLQAKIFNSAKASLAKEKKTIKKQTCENIYKDEDLIYPSKELQPSSFSSPKKLLLDFVPPYHDTREKRLSQKIKAFSNKDFNKYASFCAYKNTRSITKLNVLPKTQPSIPTKNPHKVISLDLCGRSFTTTLPPISAKEVKAEKFNKK